MKKFILVLSFILLFSISYSQKFGLGIKSGSNFATQDIKSIQGTKSITGLHLGIFTYIKLPIIFGIQAELQYSMQGTKVNASTIRNINYINIPLLIKSKLGPINLHFGPQFGLLTSAIRDVDGIKNDIKDKLSERDFSLVFGVSVEPIERLIFSMRYAKGLRDISDEELDEKTKNTVFQFSLGYILIRLGDKKSDK